MARMRALFSLILVTLFLTGLVSCKKDPMPRIVTKRTVLVYMAPDRNLYNHMLNNIVDMTEGMKGVSESNLLVFFHPQNAKPQLIQILPNGTNRVVKEYSTGKVSALEIASVLANVQRDYPAESYGLVISSHGDGWLPESMFSGGARSSVYGGVEQSIYEQLWQRPDGSAMTKALGPDSQNKININDLAAALPRDCKLDFIMFDACFMACVEVAYELRHSAEYIISSPAEVMGYGFPYKTVVPAMMSRTSAPIAICEHFMSFYRSYYIYDKPYFSGAISLVKTTELDALAQATRAVLSSSPNEVNPVSQGVQFFERLSTHVFHDLDHYIELSCTTPTLYAAFKSQLSKTLVFNDFTPTIYSDYSGGGLFQVNRSCGLTTYIPRANLPVYNEAHSQTSWAKAVRQQ